MARARRNVREFVVKNEKCRCTARIPDFLERNPWFMADTPLPEPWCRKTIPMHPENVAGSGRTVFKKRAGSRGCLYGVSVWGKRQLRNSQGLRVPCFAGLLQVTSDAERPVCCAGDFGLSAMLSGHIVAFKPGVECERGLLREAFGVCKVFGSALCASTTPKEPYEGLFFPARPFSRSKILVEFLRCVVRSTMKSGCGTGNRSDGTGSIRSDFWYFLSLGIIVCSS